MSGLREEQEPPDLQEAPRPPVLALVGPTTSGKTDLAVDIAVHLGAEVVGIDSMQIYRGMDIGTAKPTPQQRSRVPHHMIDVADPDKPWSVATFQSAARSVIAAVWSRGKIPLLVGGSGLYFRAVVDEMRFPPTDPVLRKRLEEEHPAVLGQRLRRLDPEAAALIDPSNVRRVVRALEVLELTGSPFSSFRDEWERHESSYGLVVAGLRLAPAELSRRIEERTQLMFDGGLVDEVRRLLDRGLREALTGRRAIGYREAVALVEGTMTREEAIQATAASTRRYARRQMIWFRRDPRVRWFDVDASRPGSLEPALEEFFLSGMGGA